MKFLITVFAFTAWFFTSVIPAASQTLGFSLGSGIVQEFDAVPQNLLVHLYLEAGDNVIYGLSAGYGIGNDYYKEENLDNSSDYYEEDYKIEGYPLEGEILFRTGTKKFKVFFGIGAGYYKYEGKLKYKSASASGSEPKTIEGLAQYFTFGADIYLSPKSTVFLQFKKLGVSGVEVEIEEERWQHVRHKRNLNSYYGILDMGLALGVRFQK